MAQTIRYHQNVRKVGDGGEERECHANNARDKRHKRPARTETSII